MIKKSVYFYVFKGEEFKYAIKISKNQFLCMINPYILKIRVRTLNDPHILMIESIFF